MNTMNNNEQAMTQAQAMTTLTEAVTTMAVQLKELVDLAKAESTVATATTTTTATTATEAAETTTVGYLPCPADAKTAEAATETTAADVEFKGSMIEQDPMDPMPSDPTAAEANADAAEAEETVTADTEDLIDKIICDISTLYDVAEFALCHEGKNIDSDHSPYAPTDNRRGLIGDYQVFISKEITKDGDHIEGSFRLVVTDKVIVNPIMDLEIRLIDDHYKIFSSENVHRMEKMKEDHDLMRFLEITDEVSSLVMSKYISK